MKLDFRIEHEFDRSESIKPVELGIIFQGVTKQLDELLGTKRSWYEQGYSRKQALHYKVFTEMDYPKIFLAVGRRSIKKLSKMDRWYLGWWD